VAKVNGTYLSRPPLGDERSAGADFNRCTSSVEIVSDGLVAELRNQMGREDRLLAAGLLHGIAGLKPCMCWVR
jgi:hypothetical protein